jgi:AbrB family looped-hinge helix DNA binding protein
MATSRANTTTASVTAKVTSKGQITIPVEVRRSLGVKAGDRLRFERNNGGFRVVRDIHENVFEKWRGIGSFPGMGKGLDGVNTYFRKMRGHDDLD